MTKEDKNLLVQDLCSRLPYGVKVLYKHSVFDIDYISSMYEEVHLDIVDNYTIGISEVKPYLFPMSSMTEEQYYEMMSCSSEDCLDHMEMLKSLRECTEFTHWPLYEYRVIDWFHKNHFDYRGLIPMGLAIDATGLNIY